MNRQTTTIIFSIIFVFTFTLYLGFLNTKEPAHTEPTLKTKITGNVESASVPKSEPGDKTTQTPPESESKNKDLQASTNTDASSFLDSFDENSLEGESSNVQAGIDLLNNPLQ